MPSVLTLIVLCPAVWAQQKWEMSFLYGAVNTPAVVVAATPTQVAGGASRSIGWSWQWTNAFEVSSSSTGRVSWYMEVPLTFVSSGSAAGLTRGSNYFTPGVRLKVRTGSRVSLYAAAGGGFAQFSDKDTLTNGQLTATEDPSTGHPAADLGGGADLSVDHFVSLRLEGRDYITPPGLGGTTGRNHFLLALGIVFHM
jgi:hypothetical protein